MRRLVLAALSFFVLAGVPAQAQEPSATAAFGLGVSQVESIDAVMLSGEAAFFVSDSVAVVGGIDRKSADSIDGLIVGLDFTTAAGGLRVHTPPAKVRLFAEMLGGYARAAVDLADILRGSSTGFVLAPGGGADIQVANRVAVRISVGMDFIYVDGDTLDFLNVGGGLVFNFGSR